MATRPARTPSRVASVRRRLPRPDSVALKSPVNRTIVPAHTTAAQVMRPVRNHSRAANASPHLRLPGFAAQSSPVSRTIVRAPSLVVSQLVSRLSRDVHV
jgi:hypothetical protein